MSEEKQERATERLGVQFMKCDWCQGRYAYRTDQIHSVMIFCDGELYFSHEGVWCCSPSCALAWVDNYNLSSDRMMEEGDRNAVYICPLPETSR